MNPLALEYKKLRSEGIAPGAAFSQMRQWRTEVIETIMKTAERRGLPAKTQKLVTDLDAEVRKLDGAVEWVTR